MKLFDLLTGSTASAPKIEWRFSEALTEVFATLCHGDPSVTDEIAACLSDTKTYCETHKEAFDERGLTYNADAETWLQLIAAVDAAGNAGYLWELDWKEGSEKFRSALEAVLQASGLTFSTERLAFDGTKNIPDWAAQFNQYAGQSGITLYFIDIDSDSYVMGTALMADYASAAEIASSVGIHISSRPE